MLLRCVAIVTAAFVALIAVVGYCPLPESMEDRNRAMFYLGIYKLAAETSFEILDWFGQGSFYDHVDKVQRIPEWNPEAPPRSASFGDLKVQRHSLVRPDGSRVNAVVYSPKDIQKDERLPGLVYLHGGGWCTHAVDVFDRTIYELASCKRMVVISVDYRMAPKYPFPKPFIDCFSVTEEILREGHKWNIDVNRVGIAGDSAGGNMAAVSALELTTLKDSLELAPLQYQLLLWPALQALDFRLPSYRELGEIIPLPSWSRMVGYWALYLGLEPSKIKHYTEVMIQNRHVPPELRLNSKFSKHIDVRNLPTKFRQPRPEVMSGRPIPPAEAKFDHWSAPYDADLYEKMKDKVTSPLISPLLAPNLQGLPPTFVVTSEFDPLRDDGLLYAARLRQAGVTTHEYMSKGYHDDFLRVFPEFLHSRTGAKSMKSICEFIRWMA